MRVKVKGGTVDHGQQPLCETCRWATVIRGIRLNDQIVECHSLSDRDRRVPFHVVSCSAYSDRRRASVHEMEEIAWILKSDVLRNQVGFVHSSSLKREERYVLVED